MFFHPAWRRLRKSGDGKFYIHRHQTKNLSSVCVWNVCIDVKLPWRCRICYFGIISVFKQAGGWSVLQMSPSNEDASVAQWYGLGTLNPRTCPIFYWNGKRLNPRTSTSSIWNFNLLHCWRNLESIFDIYMHQNLPQFFAETLSPTVLRVFWIISPKHVADVFGLLYQHYDRRFLFDDEFGHGNHSGELLLFVGCFVNFVVSYLICMFQDSVPAGSYNDPFLSSVISMVAPTWCPGAIWGNPL